MMTDQLAQKVGQHVLDALRSAGSIAPAQGRDFAPVDIGRLVFAYANIEDPRIRRELVSLIEVISGSSTH
jgi:hypothetical protein